MRRLLPEWVPQDAILLAWPTDEMDWANDLYDVHQCYCTLIRSILSYEPVVVLCKEANDVRRHIGDDHPYPMICIEEHCLNDTWARDFGPLSLSSAQGKCVVDFGFNAWGMKFAANHDNTSVRRLMENNCFCEEVERINALGMIFEGGAIETDGAGVGMTTRSVLEESNRNPSLSLPEQKAFLKNILGLQHLHVLDVAPLPGDDTDGHIDTLARFADRHTLVYSHTEDTGDPRYENLCALREQILSMRDTEDAPYRCVALPVPSRILGADGEDLPATYANFLIANGALFVPIYGVAEDLAALHVLQEVFPKRKVVPIDCSPLIRQHGSLHCITMQIPEGFLSPNLLNI